ncbi:MAG: T9SS type A sorting domain-containing protein, partial [Imperialibacter sp.]
KASGLYLLDLQSGKLVDMKTTGSHMVDLSRGDFKFEIYFSGSGNQVIPNQLLLGDAYPNPASTQTTIPLLLPGSANELVDIDLSVYDMNGNKVATLASGKHRPGAYEFTWDIGTAQKRAVSGLFFYRLSFGDNSRVPLYKKLILR